MDLATDTLAFGRALLAMGADPSHRDMAWRKAVHCAYYAAFTALCEEWAETFDRAARATASRMLDHGTVKSACSQIATGKLKGGVPCPAGLLECAELLPQLLASRFEADYDPIARFERSEVELKLTEADQVIQALRGARRQCRSELHLFLLQCAGAKR